MLQQQPDVAELEEGQSGGIELRDQAGAEDVAVEGNRSPQIG
jgi:hypothetical protein